MIASVTGEGTPQRCDDDYVRETFDQDFAKSYELQLQRIEYKVPELVGEAIKSLGIDRSDLDVLDAGCGTGLCAAVLRPVAGQLIGIDLSGDMLAEATKRKTYDELHEHELTDYLESCTREFGLIVSGDTLCYFGQLDDVLAGASKCLKKGGHVVFTVERYESDDEEKRYELQPHGRYRHRESYVRQALSDSGRSIVAINSGTLRMERGRAVDGLIVIAKR